MKMNHYSKIATFCSVCISLLMSHMASASSQLDEKEAQKAAPLQNLTPQCTQLLQDIEDITGTMGCGESICPLPESLSLDQSVDQVIQKVAEKNQ